MKTKFYTCACHSSEHTILLHYDDDNFVSLEVHLCLTDTFLKRLKNALKYVFGFKTCGHYDEFLFTEETAKNFRKHLKKAFDNQKEII